MPRLSDSMEEGTILKWLVAIGEQISAGDPLLEIETDKANVTHPAEHGGTLVELLKAEGDSVKVGAPIARIEAGVGGATASAPEATSTESPPRAKAAKGAVSATTPSRHQQTVARRMAESKATAPDYSLRITIDMTACAELRERMRDLADPAPTLNDMIVKGAANALREFPRLNGAYRDGRFESYSRVNVAIAVAAGDTVIAPTIHDADERSLGEIARRSRELVERARSGAITQPELSGATFTISNLGMFGVESFTGVISPPQAALLTVGVAKDQPVVDGFGRIVARKLMSATLTCDHRILFGADAARYLARLKELLEQTAALAL